MIRAEMRPAINAFLDQTRNTAINPQGFQKNGEPLYALTLNGPPAVPNANLESGLKSCAQLDLS
jgi:hypothetical protein